MAEKKARSPEWVRNTPQFLKVKEIADRAEVAAKDGAIEVVDEESAARVAESLTTVAKAVKVINKERLDTSEPYRQSTDAINGQFKEIGSPLEGAEERMREEIASYNRRVKVAQEEAQRKHEEEVRAHEAAVKKQEDDRLRKEAAEAEERRKAEEDAKLANEPPPPPPPATPPPAPPAPPPPPPPPAPTGVRSTSGGSVSPNTIWKFEVIDEAMVPSKFKTVNMGAIRQAIKDGERQIVGLRIFPEERTRVR